MSAGHGERRGSRMRLPESERGPGGPSLTPPPGMIVEKIR